MAELEATITKLDSLVTFAPEPYQIPHEAEASEHAMLHFAYNQAKGFGAAAAQATLALMTERQRGRELQRTSATDSLTGLLNRYGLQEYLDQQPSPQALLYLDGTNFKAVNDTLGHARGDRLLQDTSGMLRQAMRESDPIARDGGDEFVIIMDNTYGHTGEQLRIEVEQARKRIEILMNEFLADPSNSDVAAAGYSIAIGVAIREAGTTYHQLKDIAEQDMKRYKEQQYLELGQYRK